jgi:hypothetical protein
LSVNQGVNVVTDGSITFEEGENPGMAPMDRADLDFTNSLRPFFIQILLLLTYEPDLLTDFNEADLPTKGRGFSKLSGGTPYRYPRWFGKNYKTAIESTGWAKGTHKPPGTHWRKGHYRKIAIGKNRIDRLGALRDRKVVWIRPVLVNSNK